MRKQRKQLGRKARAWGALSGRALAAALACLMALALPAAAEEPEQKGPIWDAIHGTEQPESIIDQLGHDPAEPPAEAEAIQDAPEAEAADGHGIGKSSEMTLMLYMCGSDLESAARGGRNDQYCASADLMEITSSGFDESKLNVIVMAGGADHWKIDAIRPRTTGIYQLGNGRIETLVNDGNAYNMSSAETLQMLLTYACEHFPAERYALILWDHGGGSLQGICSDINFPNDSLSMQELDQALRESPFAQRKLSWIGFDACLMASAEVAQVVAPYAEYMVASEESEPGWGWNYSFVEQLSKDEFPEQTGKRIIRSYFDYVESAGNGAYDGVKLTMSCVDLSQVEAVAEAVERFFEDVAVTRDNFAKLSRVRRSLMGFGRSERQPSNDYDLVDLGEMAQRLADFGDEEKARQLAEALDGCVVQSHSTAENCTGLTVYYPFYNKAACPYFVGLYDQLGFSERYQSFVADFGRYLISNGSSTWNALDTLLNDIKKDNRTVVSLQLTQEQLDEIGVAEIITLAQGASEDAWYAVAVQDARIGEDGTLSGEYVHTNLFVTDENGVPMFDLPLEGTRRDDGAYLVTATLVNADGAQVEAELVCRRDEETNLVTVSDVYLYDEVIGGYSPRLRDTMDRYVRVICRVRGRRMSYDANGALEDFDRWPVVEEQAYAWDLSQPWQLAFVQDRLEVGRLRVGFRITDVFNNVYLSTPIALDRKPAEAAGFVARYDDDLLLLEDIHLKPVDGAVRLTARLTNRTEEEAIIVAARVAVNGASVDVGAEVCGNGEFEGLLPGESQTLVLRLPLDGTGAPEKITFDLVLVDADEAEVGTVPVSILASAL